MRRWRTVNKYKKTKNISQFHLGCLRAIDRLREMSRNGYRFSDDEVFEIDYPSGKFRIKVKKP